MPLRVLPANRAVPRAGEWLVTSNPPGATDGIVTVWEGTREDLIRLRLIIGLRLMWNSPLNSFLMLSCSWQGSEREKAPGLVGDLELISKGHC